MKLIHEFAPALFLLVAAIVVFGGGRSVRVQRERLWKKTSWQVPILAFAACAFVVVYFVDVLSTSSRPSWTLFAYVIVTAYEAVKLFVLFGFAYFVCSRFLSRAEGRVSTTRTTIGFVLIAILIFGLILIATNELPAFAWALVAAALWRLGGRL